MTEPETFHIFVDGRPIPATDGQSLADALLAAGVSTFRTTASGEPRGPHCNMGICHECRMVVDGTPNVRTCMTPARPGVRARTQHDDRIEAPDENR
jgi:aerobic-type carbon monoxide dehydrogenase small subunit (CoxS/CutS family)